MWAKIDGSIAHHPKLIAAGPVAAWLYVCGLTYAATYGTDGFIPEEAAPNVTPLLTPHVTINKLVAAGLWHREQKGEQKGYQIHDYLDWQPSAETIAKARESGRKRAAAHRQRQASNGVTNAGCSRTEEEVKLKGIVNTPPTPPQAGGSEREHEQTDMLAFPKPGQRERAQLEAEPLYPALVAAVGKPISQKSRDELRQALDDLEAAGATSGDISMRAANYHLVMSPGIPISASALVNNWAKCEYAPVIEYDDEQEHRDAHGFREAGAVAWARRYGYISDQPQQRDG